MTPRRSRAVGVRFRWQWTVRLLVMDLRRHRRGRLVGTAAFAVATVAALACVLFARTLRELDSSPSPNVAAQLVAFLRDDVPAAARDRLASVLERLPDVAGVRQLSGEEALARLRSELGDRAPVLDGVEEGFLPATLEISVRGGDSGVGRADTIAWRLRRMEGVADVDVLRTTADERFVHAELRGHRLGQVGFAAAAMTVLLALVIAGVATRLRGGDRALMSGFGFTAAGLAGPVALSGALCGAVGAAVGVLLAAGIAQTVTRFGWTATVWSSWVALPVTGAAAGVSRWAGVTIGWLVAVVVGGSLGWWGARPRRQEAEDLAIVD